MESLPLLTPQLATTMQPLCFGIDTHLGPIPIKFKICFSLVAAGDTVKLRVDWGSGHVDLPLITSCQKIFSIGIAEVDVCISNIQSTAGHPSSFDIEVEVCADFPFIGHQCITLLSKHIGLGILKVADLRAAVQANHFALAPSFQPTSDYVAFLYEK